jgi:hypothetical protein
MKIERKKLENIAMQKKGKYWPSPDIIFTAMSFPFWKLCGNKSFRSRIFTKITFFFVFA